MLNVGERAMLVLLFAAAGLFAQTPNTPSMNSPGQAWQLPFASHGNSISLEIRNNSGIEARNVSVVFNSLPSWLDFKSNTTVLKAILPNSSAEAEFVFSVDRMAPVGKDTTLTATIATSNGQTWTKEISISVGAPKDYKLYSNFPNPFNPSTKIAFELPKISHVTLTIYDVLGREVAEVADQDYPAGYNEITWNGLNNNGERVSSGVYLYRISAGKWSAVKKMMMVK